MLEMLLSHLETKNCRDQIYLLMYEPNAADLLYALLQDKTFSVEFKQKLLKVIFKYAFSTLKFYFTIMFKNTSLRLTQNYNKHIGNGTKIK